MIIPSYAVEGLSLLTNTILAHSLAVRLAERTALTSVSAHGLRSMCVTWRQGPLNVSARQLPVEARGWSDTARAAETLVVIRYLGRESRTVQAGYALRDAAAETSAGRI